MYNEIRNITTSCWRQNSYIRVILCGFLFRWFVYLLLCFQFIIYFILFLNELMADLMVSLTCVQKYEFSLAV